MDNGELDINFREKIESNNQSQASIEFSIKVVEALKHKVKEHNSKYAKKVNLSQLKEIFRKGAEAYGSFNEPETSITAWSLARVNAFLRFVRGGKVKDSYKNARKDLA